MVHEFVPVSSSISTSTRAVLLQGQRNTNRVQYEHRYSINTRSTNFHFSTPPVQYGYPSTTTILRRLRPRLVSDVLHRYCVSDTYDSYFVSYSHSYSYSFSSSFRLPRLRLVLLLLLRPLLLNSHCAGIVSVERRARARAALALQVNLGKPYNPFYAQRGAWGQGGGRSGGGGEYVRRGDGGRGDGRGPPPSRPDAPSLALLPPTIVCGLFCVVCGVRGAAPKRIDISSRAILVCCRSCARAPGGHAVPSICVLPASCTGVALSYPPRGRAPAAKQRVRACVCAAVVQLHRSGLPAHAGGEMACACARIFL